jgi:hypothetical protein
MRVFITRVKQPNAACYYSIYQIHENVYSVEKWSGRAFADDITNLTKDQAKMLMFMKDSKVPKFVLKEIICI